LPLGNDDVFTFSPIKDYGNPEVFNAVAAKSGAFGQSAAFARFTRRALDPQGASVPGGTVTATTWKQI
jgi:hypothetical protein